MKELWLCDIDWSVTDVMDVIRGLRVTHLDKLSLSLGCKLRDSALPDKHLCHLYTLVWWAAPVDILVMRTLLECFPSHSVRLHDCEILHCEEKITITNPPAEMVSLGSYNITSLCYIVITTSK